MDKLFKVTVNGNTYDVRVEEVSSFDDNSQNKTVVEPKVETTQQVEVKPQIAEPVNTKTNISSVSDSNNVIEIKSPMPGGIWKILKKPGDTVKKHETILILEVMKMENEIVAPQDGVIASILVKEAEQVAAGQVIVELK